jgi:hypothetical protein
MHIFCAGAASAEDAIFLNGTNAISFQLGNGGGGYLLSSQLFRDPTNFFHLCLTIDTTQATAADRVTIEINGVAITDFDSETYPTQNYDIAGFLQNGIAQYLGRLSSGASYYFDGYLSEICCIDGLALDASNFGQFKNATWIPKAYAGSYGTNGFHLDFANAGSLGDDVSGNGNDWTPSGLTSDDQVIDTPTNNFITLNSIHHLASATLANGNLEASGTENEFGTFGLTSGKWAWEITVGENGDFGIEDDDGNEEVASDISAEVVEMLLDLDSGTLKKRVDGGSLEDIELALDTTKTWFPYFKAQCAVDFGQLGYTPYTGYKLICSENLPEPTILDSENGFIVELATGANINTALASARSGWPGYIDIIKNRDASESWEVIFSDDPTNSMHFDSDAATGAKQSLVSGDNYVGRSLRLGAAYGVYTAEISHTNGSDTDQAHGLSGSVFMGVVKRSDAAGGWYTSHPGLTAAYNVRLDSSAGETSTQYCDIDGTNITIKSAAPSGTYRVIAIAEMDGFSKIFTYTGNGSADGPCVNLGLRPAWPVIKQANGVNEWYNYTADVSEGNPVQARLRIDLPEAEVNPDTTNYPDLISSGIKIRSQYSSLNSSGNPMIGFAFAEMPFKYSNAR